MSIQSEGVLGQRQLSLSQLFPRDTLENSLSQAPPLTACLGLATPGVSIDEGVCATEWARWAAFGSADMAFMVCLPGLLV